jgi:hypothetical protein
MNRNYLERTVYKLLRNNEALRLPIVRLYQRAFSLFASRRPLLLESRNLVARNGYFFGFHDKSPFNENGNYLLAHKPRISDRKVVKFDDVTEIGFFSGSNWENYNLISTTNAWNWQLGSMLQWVGSSDSIAYNEIQNGKQLTVFRDIEGKLLNIVDSPLSHATDNNLMTSYDFAYANIGIPGYGSVIEPLPLRSLPFKIINTSTQKALFEIGLQEAIGIENDESMNNSFHYFHHSLFSLDSKNVFFMHRWQSPSSRRYSRLFIYNIERQELRLAPTGGMVSHLTWFDNKTILGYMRDPMDRDGFYLLNIDDLSVTPVEMNKFNSDGHPFCRRRDQLVICDSYPDRSRYQYLFAFKPTIFSETILARFFLPLEMKGQLQIDLHPRLHPTKDIVSIDFYQNGSRSLGTLEFNG